MCVVAAAAYLVEMMTTLKIRKNCFSLKVPIQDSQKGVYHQNEPRCSLEYCHVS